ncbi:DNA-directed RNA polymerase, mitochondrial [Eumeta japonica]|uniref:DNA-directed RNA polymerase n=1 Tax=Eumeta variegata TaxID=151549 RepID=A0A4C1SHE0_EUMVA|nr:DNA-directed RNA polymerase, mitochondrial [Eumeta japonica]
MAKELKIELDGSITIKSIEKSKEFPNVEFCAIQQWERINSVPTQNIYPALDSLNQLASVPMSDILDIIIEVFQKGGDSKLNVAQPPNLLPSLPSVPEKDNNISNAERAKLFKEKMIHRRKQSEMYSLWCDTLYRLSLANHYRDKVFWLLQYGFQGRVYPLPPHLNHLGSDLARSMLIFDQPKPLGVDGFSWLKLHCINLTGLKKENLLQNVYSMPKKPQDVYSSVAALVEKTRRQDAENGLHVAQVLNGFVRRKVIKQTVMTTVYGVTRYGARLQIARQLKDIDEFPKEWVWPAPTYLTTKTFESLREMFTSTREIQDWFTDCARLISSVCGKNVAEMMATDMYEIPNAMKQKNAFPPNFIHSLDSSHMMLTSLHCEQSPSQLPPPLDPSAQMCERLLTKPGK